MTIDQATRIAVMDALKRGTIKRARLCWEGAPCVYRTVRPIHLDDEAAYAADTVLRVLARHGYTLVPPERSVGDGR